MPRRDVEFLYYLQFDGKAFAFYRVNFKRDGSEATHLSGETLLANGISIPMTPSFEMWKREVYSRRRCGQCWVELDGTLETVSFHNIAAHTVRRKTA